MDCRAALGQIFFIVRSDLNEWPWPDNRDTGKNWAVVSESHRFVLAWSLRQG